MSHLQLSRDRPRNSLNQPAPIEVLVPAEIRNVIYLRLAPVDQFKVNFCRELQRVFNPYEVYLCNTSDPSFPMIIYMYSETGLPNKLLLALYTEYRRHITKKAFSRFFSSYTFTLFTTAECYPDSLESYYKYMSQIYEYGALDCNKPKEFEELPIDTYIVFIKFCLIKLKKDRLRQKDDGEWTIREVSNLFWKYMWGDDRSDKLDGVWNIYYKIYCTIVTLLMYRKNTDIENDALYSILVDYFINETFELIPELVTNIVNEDSLPVDIMRDLRYEFRGTIELLTLELLQINYSRDSDRLFELEATGAISLAELETHIVRLIDKKIITDFRDIQQNINKFWPRYISLYENKYIMELNGYSPLAEVSDGNCSDSE